MVEHLNSHKVFRFSFGLAGCARRVPARIRLPPSHGRKKGSMCVPPSHGSLGYGEHEVSMQRGPEIPILCVYHCSFLI